MLETTWFEIEGSQPSLIFLNEPPTRCNFEHVEINDFWLLNLFIYILLKSSPHRSHAVRKVPLYIKSLAQIIMNAHMVEGGLTHGDIACKLICFGSDGISTFQSVYTSVAT